jgi:transposase
MRRGSPRGMASPAAGHGAAHAHLRPMTSVPDRLTSSARFDPPNGKGAGLVLPFHNTATMQLHLAEIARAVAAGAHAVVLLDQAGWHTSAKLEVPDNITLLPLPPKAPELNPVENVWQFLRQNGLSNRVFNSYDDILDHCCHALNKLVDQPWRIMSIGLRDWAHGS